MNYYGISTQYIAMMCAIRVVLSCVVFLRFLETAGATILLRTGNYTFQPIADINAQFGPPIPPQGLSGHLLVVDPEDACTSPLKVNRKRVRELEGMDGLPWIALVQRSHRVDRTGEAHATCTFDVKVANAEKAGAAAVIIYDDFYEGLIMMSKPVEDEDPGIPSVFISRDSGYLLRALIGSGGLVQVIITPVSDVAWMSMLMSVISGFFALGIVIVAFCLVKINTNTFDDDPGDDVNHATRSQEPLSKRQLNALRVVVFDGNESNDVDEELRQNNNDASSSGNQNHQEDFENSCVCAICLDQFEAGDKLRILPCRHRFHKACIDEWLLTSSAQCPLCKQSCVLESIQQGYVVFSYIPRIISSTREACRAAGSRMLTAIGRGRSVNDTERESEMGRLIPQNTEASTLQVVVERS